MISTKKTDRINICYKCNIFHETCDGKSNFKQAFKADGTKKFDCDHRRYTPENKQSPIQVAAFGALFRKNLRLGLSIEESFATAIVKTSDTVFKRLCKEKKGLIEEYLGVNYGKDNQKESC